VRKSPATNRLSKRYALCNVNVWNDMAERGDLNPRFSRRPVLQENVTLSST
jgi:hypothetical protein